jgi:hypothetical protein
MRTVMFVILSIFFSSPIFAAIVRIPNGDCSALSNAVTTAATQPGETTVLLARNGTYSGCGITMPSGTMTIDGQGSHMQFFSACLPATNTSPAPTSLTLRNLTIGAIPAGAHGALCSVDQIAGASGPTVGILNGGMMTLESVTLEDLTPPSAPRYLGYIWNVDLGVLTLRNVTVANVHGSSAIISNFESEVDIYSSTFVNNSVAGPSSIPLIVSESDLTPPGPTPGFIQVSNSLFIGNGNPVCGTLGGQPLLSHSFGGNFANETSCGFSAAAGDRIESDAGLSDYANHGGLVSTQALGMTSRARTIGIAQYCEAVDARGETRNPGRCDAGAYEFGGGQALLSQGGMNGVFYNQTYNGNYVSIQRLDTGSALVIWNTFDQKGSPAWVYGVASVNGTHLHTDASQNLGAVLQPGTAPLGYHAHPWGSIDIDLSDCDYGNFAYDTALPTFGKGQFALTRLANIGGLQCSQ